jgi:hypothetical protein
MGLALPHDVVADAARILNVFVAVENLPNGLRLFSGGVPQIHREDQSVAARIVLEDALGRRIGKDATVPVELPSMRTAGKAGGSAPDAMTWLKARSMSRESK